MNLDQPEYMPEVPSAEAATVPDDSLALLLRQFEERCYQETSDVRATACNLNDIIQSTESLLNELEHRPFWKRVWQRLVGYSYRLEQRNFRNQLKLQHTTMLLVTAIARQNRMVMEGLQLTLEKLHRVEEDARYIREKIISIEERRERRYSRWERLTRPVAKAWRWLTAKTKSFGRSS